MSFFLFLPHFQDTVVAWQEDGSIVIYSMAREGTLKKKQVLNGHIQGEKKIFLFKKVGEKGFRFQGGRQSLILRKQKRREESKFSAAAQQVLSHES